MLNQVNAHIQALWQIYEHFNVERKYPISFIDLKHGCICSFPAFYIFLINVIANHINTLNHGNLLCLYSPIKFLLPASMCNALHSGAEQWPVGWAWEAVLAVCIHSSVTIVGILNGLWISTLIVFFAVSYNSKVDWCPVQTNYCDFDWLPSVFRSDHKCNKCLTEDLKSCYTATCLHILHQRDQMQKLH